MKHSVIAIFERKDVAYDAASRLLECGFAKEEVQLALPKGDMGMDDGNRDEPTEFAIGGGLGASGAVGTSVVTFTGLPAIFPGFLKGGDNSLEGEADLQQFIKDRLGPQGAIVVVHSQGDHAVSAFEILNSYGGQMMDSTRPEEQAMYEGYNLKQVPVGEIFEQKDVQTGDATEGGNQEDTLAVNLEDDTIPIPAHIISEYGFVDPNIGPGNKDYLFNEFAEEDSTFDLETRDELEEEMVEEQEMKNQ
jgi:hypothetical protein